MGDDLSDEQMAELEQLKSVYERNRAIEMGLIGLIPGVKGAGESGMGLFRSSLSRRTGSPGIENFGEGTPAMLHGREAVLTEDQLFKMARGTFAAGSNIAVNNLLGSELFKIASGAFSAGVSNSRPRLDENRVANITDESNSRPRLDENRMANITNDAFSKVLQDSKSRLSENEINRIASNAFSADRLNSLLQVDQKLRQIEKDADNTNLISAITDLKDSYSSVSPSDNQTVNNDLTQKVDQLNSTMQDVLTVLVNSHDVEKRQLQSFRNSGNNLYKSIG
jgi:predicted polyphosphate/ATP-dependent NAD kinase